MPQLTPEAAPAAVQLQAPRRQDAGRSGHHQRTTAQHGYRGPESQLVWVALSSGRDGIKTNRLTQLERGPEGGSSPRPRHETSRTS